jgi:uncharacterized repeat protein (TIGR01451 family)
MASAYKKPPLLSKSRNAPNRNLHPTYKAMSVFLKKLQSSYRRSGYRLATSLFLSGLVASGFEGILLTRSAQAAPSRKDWCGTVWSVENTSTLAWINPATGVTTTGSGPTSQIAMPGGSMGTSVAAIGIHKESGTMFAFDRNGTTGQLYKFRFGVDAGWTPVAVSGLVGLSGTQSIAGASNNLNKMTVDGNILYIADSTGIAFYSINLNSSGTIVSAGATVETYSYAGDPVGTPAHSTTAINGGDITTDEYGDTYNITYNATNAFFYKQDPVARTWIYQGQTTATAAFAGAAFYKGDLFVKAGSQLKKVDLTRFGSGYTGWNNPLVNIGAPSATSSADLTSCGDPSITVTKTQQIYNDAAATTLATDQAKVKPGQYIKYTVTMQNKGDSWSRSTNLSDDLPIGISYVPNSAILNGTNLGLVTYPSTGFSVNSPGLPTGIIPFGPDPDTATLIFVAQVTATAGSIKNRATASYLDSSGLPSEPPNCLAGLNCGETPTLPVDGSITVSGNVFEDKNSDVIINNGELGTSAGSATLTIYALDATGKVIAKSIVAANGSYMLTNIPGNSTVTLRLSNDSTVALGSSTPPPASLPTDWTNTGESQAGTIETTTPGEMTLTTALTNLVDENFGIKQVPSVALMPNLLLVKRITLINNQTNTKNGDLLNQYYDDSTNPYDDNKITVTPPSNPMDPKADTDKWPDLSNFLIGGINGGEANPNDSLEYTIYFLSSGDVTARNVLFCDRVPDNVSFLFNGYGGSSPLGLTGTERGIELFHNSVTTALSNVPDGDVGQYFPPGVDPKGTYPNVNCQGANTNGAVVVRLGDLPNASAAGTPDASYGYVRFKVYVK